MKMLEVSQTLIYVSLLLTVATFVRGKRVCCPTTGCFDNEGSFKHLPLPTCEDKIQPKFLWYHTRSPQKETLITPTSIPSSFDVNKRTYFIIHGYINDKKTEWMHEMKDLLLDERFCNVIIVGWGKGSKSVYYPQAASNTRVVGAVAAQVADALIKKGLRSEMIHCIGHSLGGHTCGFLGKRTELGRITGLDPAGPKFEGYSPDAKLNKRDANYVDIIHSMGREGHILDYGTMEPMGHVDFYPNGGGPQPGCKLNDIAGCSHARAILYFMESILRQCYRTTKKCLNSIDIPASCYDCGLKCQKMGLSSVLHSEHGLFYLETNSRKPFCKDYFAPMRNRANTTLI